MLKTIVGVGLALLPLGAMGFAMSVGGALT